MKTKTVPIDLAHRSYDIRIASGILGDEREFLDWIRGHQILAITNEVVGPLYLEELKKALPGKEVVEVVLPDGEQHKSLETVAEVFDRMLAVPLDRQVTVVALGGGVIGDLSGFVAACYQRGVGYIQVPTTLLSQVDSSVGGKTAVNHASGKNMIGAFYQPLRVIADLSTLRTLEPRQFSSGMAEVIKYGLINDPEFFAWLEENIGSVMDLDEAALAHVIERSCLNKARVVEEDEREQGVRALLNLGHTFGHAIETATGYGPWLHGEAVGLGMLMAARMSALQGWVGESDFVRIRNLLRKAGLPTEPSKDFTAKDLRSGMKTDKKVLAGKVRFILMQGIGKAFVCDDYDETALNRTLEEFAAG
ncbi:MAG: 3-dehydroquinate synthase [Gammaproteobacteria bacterium]|nr:3-dehydroquinate synthase [Gammaproteobacteria bacterium]MYD77022.1 3-dehydroquinate synthase [Gammaproteobacteria bacterium]MYJ53050.1 3-dehydroquinate synthase [Gammaproteobacteria bacterium]